MTVEYRAATVSLTPPQAGPRTSSGATTIGGLTLPWAPQTSQDLGGFVEQWSGVAFRDQEAAGWPGVLADFSHDGTFLLGSTLGGTLRLNATPAGLLYEIDLPAAISPYLGELVMRGDLTGASIAFSCVSDQWQAAADGMPLRTVNQAILRAVSLVPNPAFEQTSAGIVAGRSRSGLKKTSLATSTRSSLTLGDARKQMHTRQARLRRSPATQQLFDDVDRLLAKGRR